jgi:hypothetical protein
LVLLHHPVQKTFSRFLGSCISRHRQAVCV